MNEKTARVVKMIIFLILSSAAYALVSLLSFPLGATVVNPASLLLAATACMVGPLAAMFIGGVGSLIHGFSIEILLGIVVGGISGLYPILTNKSEKWDLVSLLSLAVIPAAVLSAQALLELWNYWAHALPLTGALSRTLMSMLVNGLGALVVAVLVLTISHINAKKKNQ